ncbi:MAG: hypothetical protein IJL02_03950 [Methanobrevibacter sp.]|uniref:hypothetical protein n=2 Tax=Methanobrevibacter sp. TaxID=66852 RepID=UPI0025FC3865|nr:hypothetical protein [Methanobrevibacter sp.]MBQ6098997.1 hypothetical protein [Methanobrevibacter sp.]
MEDNTILKVIDSKINDYDKMLSEVMESETPDEKLASKYRYYVMCLTELRREFFFKEHAIFELLRENHEKHDTEFVFMDDSSYTVKKDDICSMNDNYVLILNKKDYLKNSPESPYVTDKALNLDNVKIVRTLS